jgi:GDP-mannose 6-dehydrogenase
MRISIFGLGYVGAVTAACFARDGHEVIGVDVNPEKVALIARGETPIIEPGLGELLANGVANGRIQATTNAEEAIIASEASLISVPTPAMERGEPDLSYVWDVCKEIATTVHRKAVSNELACGAAHVVVLRSTVPPGTLERCQQIFDDVVGADRVHLAFNPEFLREGTAIQDYDHPPYTIVGTQSPIAEATVREMYAKVNAPVHVVKPAVAEMVKCVANGWHAAKVGFANEIGRIAKGFGVDGRDVMNIITQDTKLNISPVYMRPGFAYGGSCLPKDLSALLYYARSMNIPAPLLNAIPVTNTLQIDLAAHQILRLGVRRVALLGLAFKSGTDDLRESPAVLLVKRLLGEGCDVKIYDKAVYEARLMGTNLAYIRQNLPHFDALLVPDCEQAIQAAELVVVTHSTPEFRQALHSAPSGIKVVDLAGVLTQPTEDLNYYGIAW